MALDATEFSVVIRTAELPNDVVHRYCSRTRLVRSALTTRLHSSSAHFRKRGLVKRTFPLADPASMFLRCHFEMLVLHRERLREERIEFFHRIGADSLQLKSHVRISMRLDSTHSEWEY